MPSTHLAFLDQYTMPTDTAMPIPTFGIHQDPEQFSSSKEFNRYFSMFYEI
jgi:hypothetical protein